MKILIRKPKLYKTHCAVTLPFLSSPDRRCSLQSLPLPAIACAFPSSPSKPPAPSPLPHHKPPVADAFPILSRRRLPPFPLQDVVHLRTIGVIPLTRTPPLSLPANEDPSAVVAGRPPSADEDAVSAVPVGCEIMATVALQSPPSMLRSRRSLTCFRPPSARQHLSNRVRSSADAGSDLVAEKDTASSLSEDRPVGTQKRSSSLISAANVQKAIRGLEDPTTETHFMEAFILDNVHLLEFETIDQATVEVYFYTQCDIFLHFHTDKFFSWLQIKVAYENKCEELMNKGLDEAEKMEELELLKESYDILSSEEERRLYDWSLVRSEKPDRYVWPFEVDRIKLSTEPPPAQEPEDVGPTRLVGYFFLAWLILSVALSVTINR
ncbi:hypothetical protein ZIOFF_037777 [Zingiber officinale]|uniref:NAD(P)H-quinone oxidoreductase subunit U, chloroplastic n=1 Tax=Zingiber officinale TaxID=94328 RepID=A0A8J5L9H5_ZINOF|nr:hypothetical protein ZIOFF_037777 [Zingiber officinale]